VAVAVAVAVKPSRDRGDDAAMVRLDLFLGVGLRAIRAVRSRRADHSSERYLTYF